MAKATKISDGDKADNTYACQNCGTHFKAGPESGWHNAFYCSPSCGTEYNSRFQQDKTGENDND